MRPDRVTVREVYSSCAASGHRAWRVLVDGKPIPNGERLSPVSQDEAVAIAAAYAHPAPPVVHVVKTRGAKPKSTKAEDSWNE